MTTTSNFGTPEQLTQYTCAILWQMAAVIQPYVEGLRQGYAEHIGPHIRHVIEHYETLDRALQRSFDTTAPPPCVDYDARERDPLVESDPQVALERIQALQKSLGSVGRFQNQHMAQPLRIHLRGGVQGDHNFECNSTVARELMFLNSHTTHHFAVLQGYASLRGESLGPGLGKAPATVAHENQLRSGQLATA